jgi:branched-chain amino acid transport system substrate-binding protein
MRTLLSQGFLLAAGRRRARPAPKASGPDVRGRRSVRRVIVGTSVVVFTLAATACAASSSGGSGSAASGSAVGAGFTNGQVQLASSYPVSLVGPDEMLGLQAYFNYVNKSAGGVKMADGKTYKIDFKYLDDGYDTGRAVSNVRSLLATFHPAAIVGLLGSAINEATISQLNQAQVPNLYSIEGDDFWQANISKYPMMGPTSQPSDNLWVASEISYVKQKFPGAKVAVLLQNDAYGQDVEKALTKDLAGSGLTVAATQYYNTGAPTLSTQIAKLAASKATVFLDFSLAPGLTQGIQYMSTIGWKVPHFVCYNCLSQAALGPAGAAANGIYAPLAFVDPTIPQWANEPAIKNVRSIITKYGPSDAKTSEAGLQGAAIGELLVDNLKASQPNSKSLLNTIRTQHGNNMSLLIQGTKVVTSPTYPYLVNQLRMAQYTYASKSWAFVAPAFVDPTYSR